MKNSKIKIGKKGGAKFVTEKWKMIRQRPISEEVFRIVDEASKSEIPKPLRKIAGSRSDLENS